MTKNITILFICTVYFIRDDYSVGNYVTSGTTHVIFIVLFVYLDYLATGNFAAYFLSLCLQWLKPLNHAS